MVKGLARSGVWVALDNFSAAILAFGFFVVLARVLSPEQFGTAALALSVIQVLSPLVDSLFHDAVVQRKSLDRDDIVTVTTACLGWSIVLAAAVMLASPGLEMLLSAPGLGGYLSVMVLSIIFSGLSSIASAEARRNGQFHALAIRTVIARVVGVAVGLLMVAGGFGIWAMVAQVVVTAALSALLLLASTGLRLGPVRWHILKPMLKFAVPTVGTQFLLYSNSRLVTLLIGGVLGPVPAGYWNVALRFVEPIQAVLATTVGQLLLPLFSREQHDRAAMAGHFVTGTRYASMLMIPCFLGLAVCAPYVIELFLGDKWLMAAPLMQIVCVVTMVALVRQIAEITLTASGRPRYTFFTHIAATALSFGGVLVGVPFGLLGAAIGWSTRAIPFLTLNAWYVSVALGVDVWRQFSVVLPSLFAGLLMSAVLLVIGHTLLSGWSAPAALAVMIGSGVALYPILLLALDAESRQLATYWLRRGD